MLPFPTTKLANFVGACVLLMLSGLVWADAVGHVTHLRGVLHAERVDGASRLLSVNSGVQPGDTLKTEHNTFARIKFSDDAEVVLRPDTVFKVESYHYAAGKQAADEVTFGLVKGGLRAVTGLLGKRTPEKFRLNTPVATIGIRGTHFGAVFCNNDCSDIPSLSGQTPENGLHTDTAQGTIMVSNDSGSLVAPAGSYSFTLDSKVMPVLVPDQQGVPVTMPPAISNNSNSGQPLGAPVGSNCNP